MALLPEEAPVEGGCSHMPPFPMELYFSNGVCDENTTTTIRASCQLLVPNRLRRYVRGYSSWLDKTTSFGGWNVESSKDALALAHVMDRRAGSVTLTRVRGWAR
ncbi:hypothetical protein V2G26_001242 [Clonostachys chloroleuca]